MRDPSFRHYYIDTNLPTVRAALGIGIALVLAISVIDVFLMPESYVAAVVPLRLGTMLVPMLAVVGVTFLAARRGWLPYLVASMATLIGIASIIVSIIAARTGAPMVFGASLYITFNIYLVLGLTLQQSAAAAGIVFVSFVGIGVFQGMPTATMTYGTLLLGVSNLVGAYAGYRLEQNARVIFDGRKELERLSRTDALTNLYNRHTFDEHLAKVWRQARRDDKQVAVVIAGIDHFKLFNDCYGHAQGDKCIIAVADALRESVNRPLDLIARYDGAEFAMVLFDPSLAFLESLTHSLCHKVVDLDIAHKASETTPTVSLSVGASIAEAAGNMTTEQLLRQADDALYEAKSQGRNQAVVYRTEWGQQTTSHLAAVLL